MAGENEMKIIFGADTSPLRSEVSKASDAVEKFAGDVKKSAAASEKGFDRLSQSVNGLPEAFAKVANGSVVLSKIAGNLQSAGLAAVNSSKAFQSLEGAPLQTLEKLDAAIKIVKGTLANGFKANLDTSGLNAQQFDKVSAEAKDLTLAVKILAVTLNEAAIASRNLGIAAQSQFKSGITEELQRAGVSVKQFKDALSSLTGVGGANLAPLLQALDSIQAESTGTTTAIKSIGGALQGVSVLAKAPINDLVALDNELKVIKATLASGFKPSIEKINLQPGDFKGVQTEINQANDSVEHFGQTVRKTISDAVQSVSGLKDAANTIPAAFEKAEQSATGLSKIGQSIESAGDAAANGAKDFQKLGRIPLGGLEGLDHELRTIKNTLATGFKPAVDAIKLIPPNFSKATQAANQFGSAAGKLKSNSNAAALALTDVSRIAQDLPFGFIGIANNINPMVESFARLKKETGSTGGALKALAGSLTGAGGLGLAIGVVTAAFTIYQNGILGFNKKTKEAKDSFEDFKASLRDSATISSDATASVQGEILKVGTLAKVITDVNKSTSERKRALAELQQVNKSYFGDLTLESAALGKLTTATDEYTKALIAQAIAKGFADEISKVSAELFKQERVLNGLAKDYTRVNDEIERVKDQKAIGQGAPAAAALANGVENATDKLNAQVKVVGDLRGTLSDLSTGYKNALNDGLKFKDLDTASKTKKETDALKQRIEALKEIVVLERRNLGKDDVFVSDAVVELKNLEIKLIRRDGKSEGFTQAEIDDIIRQRFPEFEEGLKFSKPVLVAAPFKFDIAADVTNESISTRIDAVFKKNVIDPALKAGAKAREALAKPFEQLASSVNATITDAFQGIGEGIADILSGASPVQAFVSIIADALMQLGKALIAFGIAKELAFKSLSSVNPFIAIGAGIAAIAAGKLLKSQLTKTHKFAEGGLVMGPTLGMVGEAGPEMIIPLNRANQFLDNAGGVDVSGELRIRGNDLVMAVARNTGSLPRRGGGF